VITGGGNDNVSRLSSFEVGVFTFHLQLNENSSLNHKEINKDKERERERRTTEKQPIK
jgi:hypothetical protein